MGLSDDLTLFSYIYAIDTVINQICIYLTMSFATSHYQKCCNEGLCPAHQCCLFCVLKFVETKTRKDAKKITRTEMNQIVSDTGAASPDIDNSRNETHEYTVTITAATKSNTKTKTHYLTPSDAEPT